MPQQERQYSKFRVKVLKILLFTGVVPLLIIASISLMTVIQARLENISSLQGQAIDSTSEKVERYLDEKMSVFNLVIDGPTDNVAEIKTDTLEFFAEELKEAAGGVNEITMIDKSGREVVKKSEIKGTDQEALRDLSKNECFQRAISGENYFGPVNYTLDGPVMYIASQIENKNREIIGVIRAEIQLGPIQAKIGGTKLGEEGFVYLVDSRGQLIASSNTNFASAGNSLSYISLVRDVVGGKVHNGLSREDKYTNSLDQRVIFSGRNVEAAGWSVISEWPWDDAFSVITLMLERYCLIILVSLVLIVVLSWIFSRLVVRPVETLSRGADEISKGNLDYKIDIETGDEMEKLGERFNRMIQILKENEELKDEFVFIAAHELRAPVTIIKGYLSMILEGDYGKVNKKTKKALEISQHLNDKLVQLVYDLLEVARSEAGKMEMKIQPTPIQENVQEILKEFKEKAKNKKIKLVYEELEKPFRVMADAYRVNEVLSNLVDNAIKYTLDGGKVTVSHEIKSGYLITCVKDEGIGIAEKYLKQLFAKFYRVKTEETKDIQGTGLGLFICKEIVERMGGKIWVNSRPSEGTVFGFSLPLEKP